VRRAQQRSVEQHDLVTAAVDIALESGLPAVTPATVAARLGVKEKAVVAAQQDGDDLVAAAFSRIVGGEAAETRSEVLAHTSPARRLAVLLEGLAGPATQIDGIWAEAWSLGRRNPALGAAVRREEHVWQELVAEVLRDGVESGDFAPIDPEEVATHLLAVVDAINVYALIGYHSDAERARMLHAVARTYLGADLPLEGPAED
jgi:AcrR family transcriptional regulator